MIKKMYETTFVSIDPFTNIKFTTEHPHQYNYQMESEILSRAVSRMKSCVQMLHKNFNEPIEYNLDNDLVTLKGILLINPSLKAVVSDFNAEQAGNRIYFIETLEDASKGKVPKGTKLWSDFLKDDPIKGIAEEL